MRLFIFGFVFAIIVFFIINHFNKKDKKSTYNTPVKEIETKKPAISEYDEIKIQFVQIQENLKNDLKLMESAIHELSLIRDEKAKNLTNLTNRSQELQLILDKLIQTYKTTKDDSLKQEYSKLASERDSIQKKIEDLKVDFAEQNELIDNYSEKKEQIQANLTELKEQEKETLLNINSFKKIQEIEKKLSSISENNYQKKLDKVQEYNAKIKATTKVSIQLNKKSNETLDDELLMSGADNKYNNEFKQNLKMEEMWKVDEDKKNDSDKNKVNDLFS